MAKKPKITEASCLAEARKEAGPYVFKPTGGELTICFEHATTIIRLEHSFAGRWARGETKDSDPLARRWAKFGWKALGPRVAWLITPEALQFRTAKGDIWLLTKRELLAWKDRIAEIPPLHWSPLSESRNAPPITERHEATIWQRSEDNRILVGVESTPLETEDA